MTQQDIVERENGTLPLGQFGRVLFRHWILIIVMVALGVAAGAGVAAVTQPRYQATATQFITGDPGADKSASYQAAQFAISRAKSYPSFIDSSQVLSGVRQDLANAVDIDTLRDDLTASNPIDTPLVLVRAEADSPELAQQAANSAARHLAEFITQVETVHGVTPIRVQTTGDASLPQSPVSPKRDLLMLVGSAVGLVIGVAVAVIHSYRPRRPRSPKPPKSVTTATDSSVTGQPAGQTRTGSRRRRRKQTSEVTIAAPPAAPINQSDVSTDPVVELSSIPLDRSPEHDQDQDPTDLSTGQIVALLAVAQSTAAETLSAEANAAVCASADGLPEADPAVAPAAPASEPSADSEATPEPGDDAPEDDPLESGAESDEPSLSELVERMRVAHTRLAVAAAGATEG